MRGKRWKEEEGRTQKGNIYIKIQRMSDGEGERGNERGKEEKIYKIGNRQTKKETQRKERKIKRKTRRKGRG